MINSNELKVTTEVLWRGAVIFAVTDVVFVTALTRYVKPADLRSMKRRLFIFMAVFFCALFGSLVSTIFWEPVYSYVFPEWARWLIPPVYGLLFAAVGLFSWWLAFRLPSNPVMNFCVLGGLWGIISHILAIYRGILDKPPLLQGASPFAAVILAAFEFIFYWCICISFTFLAQHMRKRILNSLKSRLET